MRAPKIHLKVDLMFPISLQLPIALWPQLPLGLKQAV